MLVTFFFAALRGGWVAGWLGRQHSYGQEFLQNTYGYHFTRTDVRHNFALWFLPQYVAHQSSHILARVHMLASAAQVVATAGLGIRFHSNVPFAVAAQALAFVAFNRVITAQYYVWVIAVLPLALVQCKVPSWLFALWLATEVRRLRLQGLRGRCLCFVYFPTHVSRICCPLLPLPFGFAARCTGCYGRTTWSSVARACFCSCGLRACYTSLPQSLCWCLR